ncbi:MAG TPA: hydroxyacid dehydrogenase [Candidatus Bathyarchaeia archaeon]|nr:hydroxyacid dehydrogenase [Candidatus Bathyarchaeia archaeon]
MTAKILICDPIHQDGITLLKNAGFEVSEKPTITATELEQEIAGYDAVIVRGRTKITAAVIQNGNHLRIIARSGVGLDNIDVGSARKKEVKVIATPAAPTTSVAELTIGLVLSILRKISYADKAIKDGRWIKSELMGSELKSKTVGIVGAAGRIGLEVARIAVQGFGATVVGYDVIDFTEKARQVGFTPIKDLGQLLNRSDIVSIHVPYMPSTHHLIDAKAIGEMKKGSILINPSRGDIVDGQALLEAIKSGKLSGAGLDVFHKEPPSDEWEKELTRLPNVVCTAHIGAQTSECQKLESTQLAEQLIEAFKT